MNNILLGSFVARPDGSGHFAHVSDELKEFYADLYKKGLEPVRLEDIFTPDALSAVNAAGQPPFALKLELCCGQKRRPACVFVYAGEEESGGRSFALACVGSNDTNAADIGSTIAQNVDCAIFMVGVKNGRMKLVYANDAFYDMLGYLPEELAPCSKNIGRKLIFHEDYKNIIRNIHDGCACGAFEGRLIRRDGSRFWVTLRSRAVEEPGGRYCVCTFQDIDPLKKVEDEMQRSNERYRLLLASSGGTFYEIDLENDTIYQSWSESGGILSDKALTGLPGSIFDLGIVFEEYRETLGELYLRIKNGSEKETCTAQCRRNGGGSMWAEISLFSIRGHDQKPVRALVILKDITKQRELEIRFHGEEKYREAMVNNSVCIITFSLASERMLSYILAGSEVKLPEGEAAYRTGTYLASQGLVHPDDVGAVTEFYSAARIYQEHARRSVRGDYLDFRMRINRKSPYIWVRGTLNVLTSPETGELICFSYVTDIHVQKEKEIELLERLDQDVLTGIFNRSAIKSRVDSFFACGRRSERMHALIMLDLDGFKRVNDTYGHDAGDLTLKELAEKLRRTSRTSDYVARLGGDEFVTFIKDAEDIEDIARKAKHICTLCTGLHVNGRPASFLSASVGIAVAPRDGTDFDTLYTKADKAMYVSKNTGKNRVSFFGADIEHK